MMDIKCTQNAMKVFFLLAAVGVVCTSEVNGTQTLQESVSDRNGTEGRVSVRDVVGQRRSKVVYVDDPCEEYGGYHNDFYIVEENPCVPRYERVLIKRRPQYRPKKDYYKRPVYETLLRYPTWAPFKPLPMPPMKPLPTFPTWKPLPVVQLKPFKLAPLPTFKPLPVLSLPKYKFPTMKPLPALPPFKFPTYAPLKPLPAFKPITIPVMPKPVISASFVPVQQASGYSFWSFPVQFAPVRHHAMGSAVNGMPPGVANGYWVPQKAVPYAHGPSSQSSLQTVQQHNAQIGTNTQGLADGYWIPLNPQAIVNGTSGQSTLHAVKAGDSQIATPGQTGVLSISQGNVFASNMSFVFLNCATGDSDVRCSADLNAKATATGSDDLKIIQTLIGQATGTSTNIGQGISRTALTEGAQEVTGEEVPSLYLVYAVDNSRNSSGKDSPHVSSTKELGLDESNLTVEAASSVDVSKYKASESLSALHSAQRLNSET